MLQKDVVIVGGGPAGSACARRLQNSGLDCMILDKQVFPRFKPCAGWITPQVLQDSGLDQQEYPHSFTTFNSFQISIKGFAFKLPTHQYAIRRIEFDQWLLEKSGVPLVQHHVREIAPVDGGFIIDGEIHTRFLVGAGGTYCPVKKLVFQNEDLHQPGDQIVAMEEEFLYPVSDSRCHLWFFENGLPGYAWYVPKSGGYVNVGVGGKALALKSSGDSIRRHWDLVTSMLEARGLVKDHAYKPEAHTYYLRHALNKQRIGNAYLVGDSAGLATTDMGEGIGAAIRSGILAAESIINNRQYDLRTTPRLSFWSILFAR
jgi:flavin-dependent dehydrogenase